VIPVGTRSSSTIWIGLSRGTNELRQIYSARTFSSERVGRTTHRPSTKTTRRDLINNSGQLVELEQHAFCEPSALHLRPYRAVQNLIS